MIDMSEILTWLAIAVLSSVAYFIRHYFDSLKKDIASVERGIASIHGQITSLQNDIRANTTAMAVTTTEMKAIWRYIDNAPKRASDNGADHDHDVGPGNP
jgi:septal ring factor EnvC (AmiA/AmiB activator)